MSYNRYCVSTLGSSKSDLTTVGYQLFNADGSSNGSRVSGVQNLGGGAFGSLVSIPDGFTGRITWDSGESSPVFASEEINLNVRVDMDQPVPVRDLTSVTTQNLADCLSASRADAVGAMELDTGNRTQTIRGPNNEIVRVFLVDNTDTPTERS